MPSRPLTISIVGWVLIALGLFWLCESLAAVFVLSSPESEQIINKGTPKTQELVVVVLVLTMIYDVGGSLFDIFIGMFILAGSKPARILYVIAEVLSILVNFRFFPGGFVLSALIAIIAIVILFLPSSNHYFAAPE
jgi:hypothetical protein